MIKESLVTYGEALTIAVSLPTLSLQLRFRLPLRELGTIAQLLFTSLNGNLIDVYLYKHSNYSA